MKAFVDKYEDRIHGVLSCFDRMLFRGYLPIMSGWSMAQLLQAHEIDCASVKPFLLSNAERVKAHAQAMARERGRPFEYLSAKMRKEDAARKIAERDNIDDGLVCVFSALEPCRTFSLRFTTGQPYVQIAKRKCLHLYYYFMDRDLGLLHVRVQTWFPLQVQIYLNGHEWLERKLTARGIEHAKIDNVFIRIGDLPRAQRLANRFALLNWPRILNRYARQVVPQLDDVLHGCEYYWVTAQAEYSTDVMFKGVDGLRELYPRLLSHSTLCFGAAEVMNFLGRKLVANFQGEVVSDLSSLVCRRTGGSRIKHRVKQNWLKMYDKAGLVLRIETVINNPEEFRVRKQVLRDGKQRTEWVALPNVVLGRGVSVPVSRDLAAGQRPLPRCHGRGRRPDRRQEGAAAPDHNQEGCRGPLLPGVQSDGATRRHLVQEPDGRRALPARLDQPRHPIAAERHALVTCLRRRPEEGQRQGRPLLQAAACARPDRQDPAHPTLARHRLRAQGHGHHHVPARASLPERLRRRHALNFIAENKEVTTRESIPQ